METSVHGISAPCAIYQIANWRFETVSPGFADAVACAHADHQRPRCMCQAEGVEMYVARLGEGYIIKRMPDTGSRHAPDCPSYEPPAECSGLGQVLGSAITEDPATGETTLKLDFPLAKRPGRSTVPPAGGESDSVSSPGTKLSLRGLLHYLWDQADLTRWHPGFSGKRTWATVRRHLLLAAEHKLARGETLNSRLYVPEPFSIEQRDVINARRLAHWQTALPGPGKTQPLLLLIGEVKEIVPARYAYKVIVKHMPDQAFLIDEPLYRRLGRHFEPELAFWAASDDVHMVMIATFGLSHDGIPAINELCLMPVTRQWLPVEDGFEKQLLDRLIGESRAFVKGLRYHLGKCDRIASALLTDCEESAPMLFIEPGSCDQVDQTLQHGDPTNPVWVWRRSGESMPPFPPARSWSPRSTEATPTLNALLSPRADRT